MKGKKVVDLDDGNQVHAPLSSSCSWDIHQVPAGDEKQRLLSSLSFAAVGQAQTNP